MKSFYEILGVPESAGDILIKRAYRRQLFKYHPDTGGGEASQSKLKEVQEAYEALSSAEYREKYNIALDILAEQERQEIEVKEETLQQGVWNLPKGMPKPFVPTNSGSSWAGTLNWKTQVIQTISMRIDDVMSKGLNGLSINQIVYAGVPGMVSSGSIMMAQYTLSLTKTLSCPIKCKLTSARYGFSGGSAAYGDFDMEVV